MSENLLFIFLVVKCGCSSTHQRSRQGRTFLPNVLKGTSDSSLFMCLLPGPASTLALFLCTWVRCNIDDNIMDWLVYRQEFYVEPWCVSLACIWKKGGYVSAASVNRTPISSLGSSCNSLYTNAAYCIYDYTTNLREMKGKAVIHCFLHNSMQVMRFCCPVWWNTVFFRDIIQKGI